MPPSELGAYLQRHREELGLGLDDVEAATRIRSLYLAGLEAGDWEALPPGVYTRGLLKTYARALGLSPASVLRMYVKERPSEARLAEPQLISQPLVREARFSFELLLSGAVLLVAVGLFGWMVVTQVWPLVADQLVATQNGDAAASEAPGSGAEVDGTDGPPDARGESTAAATASATADGTAAARVAVTAEPAATTGALRDESPGGASRSDGSPTPVLGLELQVEADGGDIWLRIRTDGEETFSGFLYAGETRKVEARQRVSVRTGNAAVTRVTLNGEEIDSLGGPGDVEEFEWRLLDDGKIEQAEL